MRTEDKTDNTSSYALFLVVALIIGAIIVILKIAGII